MPVLTSRARLASHPHDHLPQGTVRRADALVEVPLEKLHLLHEAHELHDEDLPLLLQQLETLAGNRELFPDGKEVRFCRRNVVAPHGCYFLAAPGRPAA